MDAVKPSLDELATEDRRKVESLLIDFDRCWESRALDSRVRQIPTDSSWRLPALVEMVKIDLERQWEKGNQIALEDYLKFYPELGNAHDVSADLILVEYEVRRQFGASAALEDYLKRFPHKAAELAKRIASGTSARYQRSKDGALRSATDVSGASESAGPDEGSLLARRQFGRYVIEKRLGRGGMGSVYLAHDTQLDRPVALKIPSLAGGENPQIRERFLREAKMAAKLDHPYLCQVYDSGEHEGRLYLTMAYVDGRSLAERLNPAGMPGRQVAALVGKLAMALQAAHDKGVIHRDLKPANIMIKKTARGQEPVIVDFGLARRSDPNDVRMTQTGHVVGTIAYMAPEQLRAENANLGPACDIYALGVILFELLTGQLPYQGSALTVAAQVLTQPTPRPTSIRPDIDPRLEAICLKAMSKEIADRHATMDELAAELTGFLKGEARPATPSQALNISHAGRVAPATGSDTLVEQFFDGLHSEVASGPLQELSRSIPPLKAAIPFVVLPKFSILAGGDRRTIKLVSLIALPILTLALLIAGVLIKVRTTEGTILLENVPRDAEVFVDGAKINLSWPGLNKPVEIRTVAGTHRIEVQKEGFKTFGEVVTFKSDGANEVTVRLKPQETVISADEISRKDTNNSLKLAVADSRKFVPLFNGKDLSGWSLVDNLGQWKIENGILHGEGGGDGNRACLTTIRNNYANFRLRLRILNTDELAKQVVIRRLVQGTTFEGYGIQVGGNQGVPSEGVIPVGSVSKKNRPQPNDKVTWSLRPDILVANIIQ